MSATRPLDDDPVVYAAWIADSYPPGWLDQFADELDRRRGAGDLRRVLEIWSLSQGAAARLFGVSRQAVAKWMSGGVPADRAGAVADLAAAADLMVHFLRRDRIPAVVRRSSAALGGLSLIQLAATDTAAALKATRQMFDFTRLHA
jgi:DNA-binding transcriptional regulator YdaS (Cro superfamily)